MSSVAISYPALAWKKIKRIGPLGTILLLHVAFFWALESGLIHQAAQAMPKEIFASFITPEKAPEPLPPVPQPVAPKTVAIVKKSITPPRPTPVINNTPSETAISVPTPSPQPQQHEEAPAAPAPVPAPVAAPAQPRTITSGVEYIQPPDVKYPAISKRMGEEGKSVIRVLINEKGHAERVEVQKSSGSTRLDDAAKQAVMRALFKPYTEDGKALPVFAIVPINFQLSN
ncbi:Ferric siderophore transport system [Collimonas arenae]|uniref:Ferric siderophore transport system n=1 Tax=Collimonas arenae TaxID=279058 RepID=A0A0A1FKY5_9BURK|nr:energy transducer TonB [Collimonas arenae]AIY43577.1 Ferric siderophore transport system [Collimonas arenae]